MKLQFDSLDKDNFSGGCQCLTVNGFCRGMCPVARGFVVGKIYIYGGFDSILCPFNLMSNTGAIS